MAKLTGFNHKSTAKPNTLTLNSNTLTEDKTYFTVAQIWSNCQVSNTLTLNPNTLTVAKTCFTTAEKWSN